MTDLKQSQFPDIAPALTDKVGYINDPGGTPTDALMTIQEMIDLHSALALPNNVALKGRNFANDDDIDIVFVSTADDVRLPAATVRFTGTNLITSGNIFFAGTLTNEVNDVFFRQRNFANTLPIDMFKLNASDQMEFANLVQDPSQPQQPSTKAYSDALGAASGHDIASAVANGDTLDVGALGMTNPNSFVYDSTGLRLWVAVASGVDKIFELDLAEPYRPSTGVDNGAEISIAAQEDVVTGIDINPAETKFIICGSTGDELNQYSFGVDVNGRPTLVGASFDAVTIDISTQTPVAREVRYSEDASKLFLLGNDLGGTVGTLYQYTVTTPGDLAGGIVFDAVTLDVTSEEAQPTGFCFKENGRKLYVIGALADAALQYDVPTSFILTGATFDNISFDVSAEDNGQKAISINPNGTIMSMVGLENATFYEYDLRSNGVYTDVEKAKLGGIEAGAEVNPTDGETKTAYENNADTNAFTDAEQGKLFIVGRGSSDPWVLGDPIDEQIAAVVSAQVSNPHAIASNPDGTTLLVLDAAFPLPVIYEYSVSDPDDLVGTITYTGNSFSLSAEDTAVTGMSYSQGGAKLYTTGNTNDKVFEYDMPNNYSVVGMSYSGNASAALSGLIGESSVQDVFITEDGTKAYVAGATIDGVRELDLLTPYNITTLTATANSIAAGVNIHDCVLSEDGLNILLLLATGEVRQYSLAVAGSLASTNLENSFAFLAGGASSLGMSVHDNGRVLRIADTTTLSVHEFTISLDTVKSVDFTGIVQITQAAYDLLAPPVATTLYVIVG